MDSETEYYAIRYVWEVQGVEPPMPTTLDLLDSRRAALESGIQRDQPGNLIETLDQWLAATLMMPHWKCPVCSARYRPGEEIARVMVPSLGGLMHKTCALACRAELTDLRRDARIWRLTHILAPIESGSIAVLTQGFADAWQSDTWIVDQETAREVWFTEATGASYERCIAAFCYRAAFLASIQPDATGLDAHGRQEAARVLAYLDIL